MTRRGLVLLVCVFAAAGCGETIQPTIDLDAETPEPAPEPAPEPSPEPSPSPKPEPLPEPAAGDADAAEPDEEPEPDDVPEPADVPADVSEPSDAPETSDAPEPSGDAAPDAADATEPEDVPEPEPYDPNVLDPEEQPASVLACDAGDAAWVARAIPAVLGRRPYGTAEIDAWTQLVEATDRATTLQVLMNDPGYLARWTDFFMDALRVNRVADKKHDVCYGVPLQPDDAGAIADYVRTNFAAKGAGVGEFNMTDLIRSSIRLDDVSGIHRGGLFAMIQKPLLGANVAALEMEITRRNDFGEVFDAGWLHRKKTCMTCHNSTWAVTDHPDPALDRHWPIPGHFESAIFGLPTGRPDEEVRAMLRHLGVLAIGASSRAPWKWHESCGRFVKEDAIKEDPVGTEGWFVGPQGLTANVWKLEALLHAGIDGLRADGLDLDPETLSVPGEEAFAYLVTANLVNEVWSEVMGEPLTVANFFPRNRGQRDAMWWATETFVASGWSLRTLLSTFVLDPRFNQLPPESGCGDLSGYYLWATWDPWSPSEDDAEKKGNSAGDQLNRHPARTFFRMLPEAMMWPATATFPGGTLELLQVAIGAFTKDAEPGFRGTDLQGLLAAEDAYGLCPAPKGKTDFVHLLVDAAVNAPGATVADAVLALKDRLVQEPWIEDAEAPLLQALAGLPLSTVAAEADSAALESGLRAICGALLESPQFLMAGAPSPTAPAAPPEGLLAVAENTTQAQCERIAPLWPADAWTVTCADGVVSIAAVPPPEEPPIP